MYLELQTNIQISKQGFVNLYKGDILITGTNYFTNEDNIIGAIYKIIHTNGVMDIRVICDESSRFIIDKHDFQNDSTLVYMLINTEMVKDISTQYLREDRINKILNK
jgi:hypothetical protein